MTFLGEESGTLRVPPHSVEAEQALLGSIFLDPEVLLGASEMLAPEDFYREGHRRIYEAMLALAENGEPVDVVSVAAKLREQGILEEVGGDAYLFDLAASVPSPKNALYYAEVIQEKALLRKLIDAAEAIAAHGYTGGSAREVLEEAERLITTLVESRPEEGFRRLQDVLVELYQTLERLAQGEKEVRGLSTGFLDLDRLLAGLRRSDLIIIAARPSVGKTAFALNIAHHVALRARKPVAFFSLEMPAEQLALRLLSAEANLDGQLLRSGELGPTDWDKLTLAMGKLSEAPFYVDDSPGLTLIDMRTRLRRLAREAGPLGLVVVDYLQLMQAGRRAYENRQQEISAISRGLKAIAREFEVPLIALSQLSRAVEQRQNKRPELSDLRESGSIEQDADVVAFLYREDYYNESTEAAGKVEVLVKKHRNGPTGKVVLGFLRSFSKFVSLSPHA